MLCKHENMHACMYVCRWPREHTFRSIARHVSRTHSCRTHMTHQGDTCFVEYKRLCTKLCENVCGGEWRELWTLLARITRLPLDSREKAPGPTVVVVGDLS